jgi:hypothetical protein
LPHGSPDKSYPCLQPFLDRVLTLPATATSTTLGGRPVPVLTRRLWRPIHVGHSCGRHKSTLAAARHANGSTIDAIQSAFAYVHKQHIAQGLSVPSCDTMPPITVAFNTFTARFVPITVTPVTGNFDAFVPRSVVTPLVFVLCRVSTNTPTMYQQSSCSSHTSWFDIEPIVIPPIHGRIRSISRASPHGRQSRQHLSFAVCTRKRRIAFQATRSRRLSAAW